MKIYLAKLVFERLDWLGFWRELKYGIPFKTQVTTG